MKFRIIRKVLLFVLLYTYSAEALRLPCGNQTHCRIGTELNNDKPSDLRARTLDTVQNVDAYVNFHTNNLPLENKIYDDARREPPGKPSVSTSLFKPFADVCRETGSFRWNPSFKMGLKGLTGCTVLLVVSRHGVYGAHFFEDVSMDDGLTSSQPMRASNLIKFGGPEFESLGDFQEDLNSNPRAAEGHESEVPYIWLISPFKGKEPPVDPGSNVDVDRRPASQMGFLTSFEYENELVQIQIALNHYWPGIQSISRIQYEALNRDNRQQNQMGPGNTNQPDFVRLRDNANGRLLIEYDHTDGNSMLRIWFEQAKIHEASLT